MLYQKGTLSEGFLGSARSAKAGDVLHSASVQTNRIRCVLHGASEMKKDSVLNLEHGFCKRNKMAAPP